VAYRLTRIRSVNGRTGRGSDGPNPLNNVYFGEQHLHTAASADAIAFGTRGDANDGYKYAKGEAIKLATSGEMIQKQSSPYDWAAVTDHAEYLGMMPLLRDPTSPLQDSEIGKLLAAGQGEAGFQLLITSLTYNQPIEEFVSGDPRSITSEYSDCCSR